MSTSTISTEELLRRYVSGALTAPEEAELERRALTEKGLSEALAGYQLAPEVNHEARIAAMVKRASPTAVRRSLFRRYAAAATVLVLVGIAALLLPRYFVSEEPAVAMEQFPVTLPEQELVMESSPAEIAAPAEMAPALPRPNERTDEVTEASEADVAAAVMEEMEAEMEVLPELRDETAAPNPAAAVPPTLARAQNNSVRSRIAPAATPPPVRGRVTTDDGSPIAGATITRPGMALGETTDSSGAFVLPYDATLDRFTVTYPGFEGEEVKLVDTGELLQISMTPLENSEAMARWFENAARQEIGMEPVLAEKAQARVAGGLRALREKIEREQPAEVPKGRVRVSFLVEEDGQLSDFKFRGRPERVTMDYVGKALMEEAWEVTGGRSVRVYLKLRFE